MAAVTCSLKGKFRPYRSTAAQAQSTVGSGINSGAGTWQVVAVNPGSATRPTPRLYEPASVAVDRQGNVYVADRGNDRVKKFSSQGRLLASWGMYSQGQVSCFTGVTNPAGPGRFSWGYNQVFNNS
jgi:hypothetical protein